MSRLLVRHTVLKHRAVWSREKEQQLGMWSSGIKHTEHVQHSWLNLHQAHKNIRYHIILGRYS